MVLKWQNWNWNFPPGGPLKYIGVHMREQKNKEKGVIFPGGQGTGGSVFRGLKMPIFNKKGCFWTRMNVLRGKFY